MDGYGCWQVRIFDRRNGYSFQTLGKADDFQDANSLDVFDFFQAQEKARQVANQKAAENAGVRLKPITVAEAAADYLQWYKENRKAHRETELTVNAHILPFFATSGLSELTTAEIIDWVEKLASMPPYRYSEHR